MTPRAIRLAIATQKKNPAEAGFIIVQSEN
jgi:hypothetical protein